MLVGKIGFIIGFIFKMLIAVGKNVSKSISVEAVFSFFPYK
jgi:hypothetical protein